MAVAPGAQAPQHSREQAHAAVAANQFTRASRRKTETFLDVSSALGSSSTNLAQVDVPATGFLRHLVLSVHVDGPAGASGLVDDAPWSVIDSISFMDVNGQPLHILSGFDLFLANLTGGYTQNADPRLGYGYKASKTGIDFTLRVPIEIIARGALGALANTNASMTYKLKITLAQRDSVFLDATEDPSVRIKGIVESWTMPPAADLNGTPNMTQPPALGTTQNWSEQVNPITVGQNTIRLARVGNSIRNLVLVRRDAQGDRADSWPDELTILLDGNVWHKAPAAYFKQRAMELFGWTEASVPAGVIVLPFTDDFDGTPGEEVGDFWVLTSGATRFEVQGTFGDAGSLTILTNDVIATAHAAGAGATLGA